MKESKLLTVAGVGVFLGLSLFLAACEAGRSPVSQPTEENALVPGFTPPDQSTPEKTLRTFWWAIKKGKENIAQECVDRYKIAEGRHGRKIEEFISEYKDIDTREFRYIATGSRVTIRAPNHNMDYDMEKREDGKWVIVSIHP